MKIKYLATRTGICSVAFLAPPTLGSEIPLERQPLSVSTRFDNIERLVMKSWGWSTQRCYCKSQAMIG